MQRESARKSLKCKLSADPVVQGIIQEWGRSKESRYRSYGSGKAALRRIVGWYASNPEYQSAMAYEIAVSMLADVTLHRRRRP